MISGPELARVTSCHLLCPFNRTMFLIQSSAIVDIGHLGQLGEVILFIVFNAQTQGPPDIRSYESHFVLQITVVFSLGIPRRLSGLVAISHVTRPMLICCGPKSDDPP